MTKAITAYQCPYCGYVWFPRVPDPVSCPKCKQYFRKTKPYLVDLLDMKPGRMARTRPSKLADFERQLEELAKYCPRDAYYRAAKEEYEHNYAHLELSESALDEVIWRVYERINGPVVPKFELLEPPETIEERVIELWEIATRCESLDEFLEKAKGKLDGIPEDQITPIIESFKSRELDSTTTEEEVGEQTEDTQD